MQYCAILFKSVHDVLRAESTLKGSYLETDVIPVPKEISPDCGMAIRIKCSDRQDAKNELAAMTEKIVGFYEVHQSKFKAIE